MSSFVVVEKDYSSNPSYEIFEDTRCDSDHLFFALDLVVKLTGNAIEH